MNAPAAPSRRTAWAVAVALAVAVAGWNAWRNRGQVFGPLQDETLLVPIALRQVGLASYAGDKWLAAVAPIFSIPYSWMVGTLLRFVDDPVVALRWLALPFHVVFLAGTWRLVERFAGRAEAATAVVVCALPPLGALLLAPGAALPRDLVFALLPWFVLATDAAPPRRSLMAFLALGVVANLHPITALHAAIWLLLMNVVETPSAKGLVTAAGRGLAFAVGAAPYVVQYLSRPTAAGAVDPTAYAWRLESMAGETWGPWAQRMEPLVWLCAAVVVLGLMRRRSESVWPTPIVVGAAAAFVLAAFGPTIGRFVPALRGFQFGRFERFAAWFAAVAFATAVFRAYRGHETRPLVAAAAMIALAFVYASVARGPLARLGRAVDRRAGVPFEAPRPVDLEARANVVDPTSPDERDAFLAVCAFAREKAPIDALFLVPPEMWGPFRVYARRGAVVTRKEGGAALSFLGGAGMEWYRDYAHVVRVYAHGWSDPDGVTLKRCADYVVADDLERTKPPSGPLVFEAGNFRVFDVRRK